MNWALEFNLTEVINNIFPRSLIDELTFYQEENSIEEIPDIRGGLVNCEDDCAILLLSNVLKNLHNLISSK